MSTNRYLFIQKLASTKPWLFSNFSRLQTGQESAEWARRLHLLLPGQQHLQVATRPQANHAKTRVQARWVRPDPQRLQSQEQLLQHAQPRACTIRTCMCIKSELIMFLLAHQSVLRCLLQPMKLPWSYCLLLGSHDIQMLS